MSDPDDFYNDSKTYYDGQHDRGEAAARIIVIAWIFFSGAAAGWILHRIVG